MKIDKKFINDKWSLNSFIKIYNNSYINFRGVIIFQWILRIIIIIGIIYLICNFINNDIIFNISYAEVISDAEKKQLIYHKKITDWDLRYNTKYNVNGNFNFALDLTLCVIAWSIVLLNAYYVNDGF
jgi:hypothetical protein